MRLSFEIAGGFPFGLWGALRHRRASGVRSTPWAVRQSGSRAGEACRCAARRASGSGRVQALEAHLLAEGGAPLADLDTIDPEWKKLARTASHGWNVRSGLLPGHQREAHRLNIRHYEQALGEREEHREKVVEAAGILASQPRTSREYKQAVWDFGMSRPLAERHDQRAKKLAGPAQAARAALAQDDTLRQAKASLIEQGDKAERKLNWLLRGRALLPMWFVTVLGPVPPAHKTQEWMDLATQVLAYRVTYGITDQVVALGAAPDEYVPHRTWNGWHHHVTLVSFAHAFCTLQRLARVPKDAASA
ncbi:CopG family transcriptional regulator [Streptomyces sp. NPDC001020]